MERILRSALLLVLFCMPLGVVVLVAGDAGAVAGLPNTFVVPKLYLLEGLIAACFALWLALRRPGWQVLRPYAGLVAVVGVAALSTWWAPDALLATTAALHLAAALMLLVMLAAEFRDGDFARAAGWTLAAAALLQAGWGIAQYLLQHDLGLQRLGESVLGPQVGGVAKLDTAAGKEIRAYGSLPHPNVLAAYLAVAIFWVGTVILWPAEVIRSQIRRRFYWYQAGLALLLLGLSAGLLLTFSRAAILITAVNGALVIFFALKRWKRLPLGAAAAAIGFFAIALLLLPQYQSRSNFESANETGLSNRAAGLKLAASMISDRPLGVGAGNFVPAAAEIRSDLPSYQYQPVHNAPLLIGAELGAIPMLLVLAFVVRVGLLFHRLRPQKKVANSLNFSVFALAGAFIAMGMTDHFFWSLPQGLWIVAAVAAAVISRIPEPVFYGSHPKRR